MENLRDSILNCFYDLTDDNPLIRELNKIIAREGPHASQIILNILTNLDLGPREAKERWTEILKHHQNLGASLGRKVDLRTAICDFFCSNRALISPKVVEIHIFEKTLRASRYDNLTNLINRRSFDEELKREISYTRRHEQDLSLLFFDLDDFKRINDIFGHQGGDMVLVKVANIIMQEKRTEDIAARYGGEEIVLILPRTERPNAMIVGDRIRQAVEKMRIDYEGKQIKLTISGGLASFSLDAPEADSLIKSADQALYIAKNSGKNKISTYSQDKRRFLRIDFCRDIQVKKLGFNDTRTITTRSKNLSGGGILFTNKYPLDFGTQIQLSIPLKDKTPLLIIGTVVRVEVLDQDNYEIGVSTSLQEMDKITKTEITKLLKQES